MEDYELTKNERGLLYYIRENQKLIASLEEEINKLRSASRDFPPIELVFQNGKWDLLENFLKEMKDEK
jgi:hypothetical protein